MEDFNKKLDELKRQVIFEIEQILPEGKEHTYKEQFYCTMIGGEISPVSIAIRIKNDGGKVILHDNYEENGEEYDTELKEYEIETIIMAYEQLRKELRAQKIERIKELVEQTGGKVKLDGSFTCRHFIAGKWVESSLQCVEIGNKDNKDGDTTDCLWFDCNSNRETHEETDSDFTDDELDSLITYIEEKTGNLDITLTEDQREALDVFNAAWVALKEKGVKIMLDVDEREFHFCNGNGFKFDVDWEGCPKGFTSVDEQLNKQPSMSIHDYCYYSGNKEEIVAKRI